MPDFQLKEYQQDALDALRDYYKTWHKFNSADTAFYHLTKRPYHPVKELPDLPYVCLRLPTGAGKTFIAAHSLSLSIHEYLQSDSGLVLWLVPSNAIREQTLKALKNRQHPYRRALEQSLGNITVMDVSEALYLPRPTLDTSTTIIISTIQAFRIDDTEGRKVYESSGALMDHFTGVADVVLAGLQTVNGSAIPKYSLANVLRIRRPIIIIDEAHNARTSLTFDVLARFNPACILELTATPDTKSENPSNILYQVSAAELKAEDMIKLPINLRTRQNWRELLSDAILQLDNLEKLAREEKRITGEYIRPIMLLQAQSKIGKDPLTIDVVRETLLNDFKIPEKAIIRHGQGYKELEGIDILDADSPIRFVLTVSALKEGWDCPSAYILCSVAEMHSPKAIEQILGRVMRLPHAKRKIKEELNQAYAFSASTDFVKIAETLKDGLVQNGFERIDAENLVKASEQMDLDLTGLPLFDPSQRVRIIAEEKPAYATLPEHLSEKITVDENNALSITALMDENDKKELQSIYKTEEGKKAVEYAFKKSQVLYDTRSPAERGEVFSIPVLAHKQDDFVEQFEKTHFLERAWYLSQEDASLSQSEYPSEIGKGRSATIDISDEKTLKIDFGEKLQQQMRLLSSDKGWTITELVSWLDRTISHPDISYGESSPFILATVQKLMDERDLSLAHLAHDKYRLRLVITQKIEKYRKENHTKAYQSFMLEDSPLIVSPEKTFTYDSLRYPVKPYRGAYQFKKHYYDDVGKFDSSEEEKCAVFLDNLAEIDTWVRNPAKGSKAFWLQTSSDKFYPDFVCKLKDGRFLVVEYKGADRWSNDDSKEKRSLGELWAERSNSQCLFLMPKGKDFKAIENLIIKG